MDLSSQIIKLKEKIDYYEFYSQFNEIAEDMRPDGAHKYWSKCPFHKDSTPSFQMNMTDGKFTCWSKCIKGGDVFDFWQHYYNVSKMKAIIDIAKWANFELEFDDNYKEELKVKSELASFNLRLMRYFQANLEESQETKDYLSKRGILRTTIDTFKLGYYSPNRIMDFIKEEEYEVAIKCGVLKRNDDGTVKPFSGVPRLIFPYLVSGYPITFTSRAFKDMTPKYLNFNNNEFVNKKDLIYGLDTAKEYIEKYHYAIIVEGQFDCMKAYQKGVQNVVAVSGIKMSESQIHKLRKHTKKFALIIEDEASAKHIKSSNESIKEAIPWSKVVIVKLFDKEKIDLDDYLSKYPVENFFEKLKDAKPYNEFVVEDALMNVKIKDTEDKTRFINKLKDHLLSVRYLGERDDYIERISKAINYPIESIQRDLRNKEKRNLQQEYRGYAIEHDNIVLNISRCLIALLFYDINVFRIINKYNEHNIPKYLLPEHLQIYNHISNTLDTGEDLNHIKLRLETDMTFKEEFMECLNKLDIIIIYEDELDGYLRGQIKIIKERRRSNGKSN